MKNPELGRRIHTSIAPFEVAAEEWFPAAAGFAVTVIVHPFDAATGPPRYLPPRSPPSGRARSSRQSTAAPL